VRIIDKMGIMEIIGIMDYGKKVIMKKMGRYVS